jgi:hypothetical protein
MSCIRSESGDDRLSRGYLQQSERVFYIMEQCEADAPLHRTCAQLVGGPCKSDRRPVDERHETVDAERLSVDGPKMPFATTCSGQAPRATTISCVLGLTAPTPEAYRLQVVRSMPPSPNPAATGPSQGLRPAPRTCPSRTTGLRRDRRQGTRAAATDRHHSGAPEAGGSTPNENQRIPPRRPGTGAVSEKA